MFALKKPLQNGFSVYSLHSITRRITNGVPFSSHCRLAELTLTGAVLTVSENDWVEEIEVRVENLENSVVIIIRQADQRITE